MSGDALLPDTGPEGTMANISDRPASDQISIYVVRPGDSLSQVAEMFSVSVNTIIWANSLPSSGAVQEGDTLVILPITGIRHSIAKGETLQSVAKKYKGDLDEILKYNGLDTNAKLAVGDVVVIPDGEAPEAVSNAPSAGSAKPRAIRGSGPLYAGYYLRPISGGRKSQGLHGYNAIDLAAPVGTPIFAAANGRVMISRAGGWNGGYGTYIVIEHQNGTQTLYSHNSRNLVSVGQSVVQGQVIGYIGTSGKTTGPHLHFEIRGAKNPF